MPAIVCSEVIYIGFHCSKQNRDISRITDQIQMIPNLVWGRILKDLWLSIFDGLAKLRRGIWGCYGEFMFLFSYYMVTHKYFYLNYSRHQQYNESRARG